MRSMVSRSMSRSLAAVSVSVCCTSVVSDHTRNVLPTADLELIFNFCRAAHLASVQPQYHQANFVVLGGMPCVEPHLARLCSGVAGDEPAMLATKAYWAHHASNPSKRISKRTAIWQSEDMRSASKGGLVKYPKKVKTVRRF
ncbi:hypothetical protein FB567DRAFT_533139 [Paraphoma chrysanthemicola]|uniref:Uncharacterized protein n=1 Tax=Paraphoma chrysanthemicola TaxID=798071 RepID=A0A8K0VVY7_9PLEO|nr:hypothetical protein FB567DRAFT_533139 [Paraphoma chrysanthemicola]